MGADKNTIFGSKPFNMGCLLLRMAEKAWYKDWFNSIYYHKLYFERDEKEADAFIQTLIGHLRPVPGSRMLDVACGKGRHSKILAALGFQVTGIDISPASIETSISSFTKRASTVH